jgi:hypothetical protein
VIEKTKIEPHDFAKKQLELTAEFGKYVFDHPEVDQLTPISAPWFCQLQGSWGKLRRGKDPGAIWHLLAWQDSIT